MSSFEAFKADVVFEAQTGQATADAEKLRQTIIETYSGIPTAALKAQQATAKFDRDLGRAGANADKQRAAVIRYRREMDALNPTVVRTSGSFRSLERDVESGPHLLRQSPADAPRRARECVVGNGRKADLVAAQRQQKMGDPVGRRQRLVGGAVETQMP